MTTEFHGADLVVQFHSNPDNVGVSHYVVGYQCASGVVTHRVEQSDFQIETAAGTRSYQDTLTFAENAGAGLTRTPTVSLTTVAANGMSSVADVEYAQNSIPVLPSAPVVTPTFDGVQVRVATPGDADLAGYVAWVDTTSTVAMDAGHERYRGAANGFAIPLADDATYYLRVAPFDAFGLDPASAWPAVPIARGTAALALANSTAAIATLNNTTIPAINSAVNRAQADIATATATAADQLNAARTTLAQAILDGDAGLQTQVSSLSTTVGQNSTAISTNYVTLTNADAAIGQRIDSVSSAYQLADQSLTSTISDNYTTLSNATATVANRTSTLESKVGQNTASISDNATTFTNATTALASRAAALESSVGANTSAISSNYATLTDADHALSTRIDTVTTNYQDADSSLNSAILTNYNTLTTATQALASRTSVVEASAQRDVIALNSNATFSNWPGSATSLPTYGGLGANGYSYMIRVPGIAGAYGLNYNVPANVNQNIFISFDGGSPYAELPAGQRDPGLQNMAPGYYVLEVDVTLNSGTLLGSGAYLALYGSGGGSVFNSIDFGYTPDASGNVNVDGVANTRYRWAYFFDYRGVNGSATGRLHPMVLWDGFGHGTAQAKNITFNRIAVRPATMPEIQANKATADVTGLTSRVSTNESAVSDLKGRTAAYWQTTAVAGNNRAQLTVRADANGGAGVDITGDVRISGGAIIDGTLAAAKIVSNSIDVQQLKVNGVDVTNLNSATMAREGVATWNGSITPNGGSTSTIPVSLTLTGIQPKGRFLYNESTWTVSSNAGVRQQSSYNGRPLYTTYIDDGGIRVQSMDNEGHAYRPFYGQSQAVTATTAFDTTFVVTLTNNNYDSGYVDQGDYYTRSISATYTISSVLLHVIWLAI